ncbi:hypothetical protein ACFFJT_17705 [Dyella flava]|uniref:Uncharacterized protein n=1 Tax=Dyella flava TaxID=1920170 RepID=A0ABS2K4P9_9GAMM|nr:hypothetical protein [Dyella flava]MBM7125650.1 hypothetical protein [Dyella flava]GLQ48836.1 hypothetical protein GCM10010872_02850 [Dyella flava]
MEQHFSGPWIRLNTTYYVAPVGDPAELLEDAQLLLGGANGIAQSLSDLLSQDLDANPADLANALWSAALLVKMGQRNTLEAQYRLRQLRGPMDDVDEEEVAES